MQRSRGRRVLAGAAFAALVIGLTLTPGRAPATVAEQRARLPPPATCKDPVAGVWQSHAYNPMYEEWGRFTLTIRRVEGSETELEGEILNESWYGPKTETVRGPCRNRLQYLVSMDAVGSYRDGEVEFHGLSWKMEDAICAVTNAFGYNLDRFSGTIDHEIQEFQSVNNDGGRYVDVPTVFRRVSCDDSEDVEPRVTMAPPPFYPPEESSRGCGFGQ
ncbi:hypothetical protein G6O69_07090 [Pseudenhygromyxa sp. WMMC2535]|uniref:hypothetical protein n=1 Tax=Pseudenhygromyxa sp. WMMC2535 TaxID=2712867 RepID=UPI0015559EBF|nr:hypothetical protein [Pseudenhygromyxa sp. WMMC2535]NVB37591.1 hypothetical protein [Pseudenhygromyxa sp. WMMC2535]